ncbi:MAG: hypothetical protein AAF191_08855 [Verrucomicrobiota bacterium]
MKKTLIAIAAVIAAVFVPVFPNARPPSQWSAAAFEQEKANLGELAKKLKAIEPESSQLFNLSVDYGESKKWTSLAGLSSGTRWSKTHAFGRPDPRRLPIPPIPGLRVLHDPALKLEAFFEMGGKTDRCR